MKNAPTPDAHATPSLERLVEDYGAFGSDYRFMPAEEMLDPGLRRLLDTWNQIRGERAMPTRPELNPFVLGGLLRSTQLFDIVDEGRDFRFRVMGSGITEQTGLNVTGKCVSQLDNEQLRGRIAAALWRVCETRAPVRLTARQSAVPHLQHKYIEAIYLPLGDGETATHVISGVVFGKRAAAA